MKTKLAIITAAMILVACTDSDEAVNVLEGMGFTDVETTGYRYFGCSEDDTFHTGFTATSPSGKEVSGVVCGDWFKGATVRFD